MQFLKSNQFIWKNQEGNYLLGERAARYFKNYKFFQKTAKLKFEGVLWFDNCTVIVEADYRWICIKKDGETDVLEIESSDDSVSKNEKFELVSSASDLEWVFINEQSEVVCSFENTASHPIHQLKDAIRRFEKQGLGLQAISEKLSDLEVFEGAAGGMKSYTYRGVVLEYEFHRFRLNQDEMNGEIIYFKLKNIQRPFEKFSADFYKVVLNSAAVDIAVFDLEQRYMLINEFAVKNKEVRNWLIGRTDFDYCEFKGTDDSMAKVRKEFFEQSKRERRMVEMEEKIIDADGNARYSLKRFKPIIVQDEIKYMMGFGMDAVSYTHLRAHET
jgi:hypothetical protein